MDFLGSNRRREAAYSQVVLLFDLQDILNIAESFINVVHAYGICGLDECLVPYTIYLVYRIDPVKLM